MTQGEIDIKALLGSLSLDEFWGNIKKINYKSCVRRTTLKHETSNAYQALQSTKSMVRYVKVITFSD